MLCSIANAQELSEKPTIPDALEHYRIGEEVKGIFQKLFEFWKPINEKGSRWWEKNIKPKLQEWWEEKKENIRQALQEEKQELKEGIKEGIKKAFSKLWEKMKQLFKREVSEVIDDL